MLSKEETEDLQQRACDGDESARCWLQEEYLFPPNLTIPSKIVEFIHTSMMNESVYVGFMLVGEFWQAINPDGQFSSTTFAKNEIHSPVYWS